MIKLRKDQLRETLLDKITSLYYRIPYDYRLGQLWWRTKDFCWNRYSTIKPRTLGHSWCDRRELLLHMSMEILGNFIEEECSPGHVIWFGEEGPKIGDKYVMDEMKEIWDWWNITYQKEYPQATDNIWNLIKECSPKSWGNFKDEEHKAKFHALSKEAFDLEQWIEDQSDEMLKRLTAVRQYMWT